jgi:hypothetical protein
MSYPFQIVGRKHLQHNKVDEGTKVLVKKRLGKMRDTFSTFSSIENEVDTFLSHKPWWSIGGT